MWISIVSDSWSFHRQTLEVNRRFFAPMQKCINTHTHTVYIHISSHEYNKTFHLEICLLIGIHSHYILHNIIIKWMSEEKILQFRMPVRIHRRLWPHNHHHERVFSSFFAKMNDKYISSCLATLRMTISPSASISGYSLGGWMHDNVGVW